MAGNHLDNAQLQEFAMGQLAPKEVGSGRERCSRCSRCRERLESLLPLVEGFGELSEPGEAPALPLELWRQISERAEPLLEGIQSEETRRKQSEPRILRARMLQRTMK